MSISATYPTVTTSAATPSGLPGTVRWLQIANPHATASIAFTFDGTTPAVNGAGVTLGPGTNVIYATDMPLGAVKLIASASATVALLWK